MKSQPRPHRRVITGRNVALTGAAIYAAARAIGYAPGIAGGELAEPVAIISMDGHALWAWALAWAIAAILCIVDMIRRTTLNGLPTLVAVGLAWGAAYGASWLWSGLAVGEWTAWWVTSVNYLTVCAIIWGLLYKAAALQDMIGGDEGEVVG